MTTQDEISVDELIQDHQHDMQNFLIEYYHGDEPNEHESFGPLYEEFLYRKATIAHLHRLQKVEAELEKCRRDAFSAGYEKAHDDTVEGCYSPEQSADDYIAAISAGEWKKCLDAK